MIHRYFDRNLWKCVKIKSYIGGNVLYILFLSIGVSLYMHDYDNMFWMMRTIVFIGYNKFNMAATTVLNH